MPTPIFHTNHSLRSILNLEKAAHISKEKDRRSPNAPPSIFDCAYDLGLNKLVVVDDYPTAFMQLFEKCPDHDLQLIYGLRFIICNDVNDRTEESVKSHAKYNVLSKSGNGYKQLSKLFSVSATDHFYKINKKETYRRIDFNVLKRYWCDDFVLVPCFYDGPIYQSLFTFSDHVPDYFVNPTFEVQNHDLPIDWLLKEKTLEFANKHGYSTWDTHSCYYRNKNEFKAFQTYKAMMNSQPGKKCSFYNPNMEWGCRDNFCVEGLGVKEDTFLDQFEEYSETLQYHGVRVAKCEVDEPVLERLELNKGCEDKEILLRLTREGYKTRGIASKSNHQEYVDRIKHELESFERLGFTRYILSIWDLCRWCNENDIPIGSGRGSCGSSLVLYLLNVTQLDPIKTGCYFGRFVNESRAKSKIIDGELYLSGDIADIDIDIGYAERERVVKEYLGNKYPKRTCKILTFNTLTSKLCLKEVGKSIREYSEDEISPITSQIETLFGKNTSIDISINGEKGEDGSWKHEPNDVISEWAKDNGDVIEVAEKLEGLVKNFGAHASGYIVSHDLLEDTMPYQLAEDGSVISGYDMKGALDIAVKLDLLGLRTADLIYYTCKDIGIHPNDIDPESEFIYQCLQNLKHGYGLFQIEKGLALNTTQKVKPREFDHLSAVLSLARPGSLRFIDKYAKYVNDGVVESLHPLLDPVVLDTAGTFLFQEQLMQVVSEVFKFQPIDGEALRKCVGKKQTEKVKEWEEKLRERTKELNYDEELFNIFWRTVSESANYSFNKCLSPDTIVQVEDGDRCMFEIDIGDRILAYDTKSKADHFVDVVNIYENEVELYEVELEDGRVVKCSMDHKFLTSDGEMSSLEEIVLEKKEIMTD